MIRCASWWKCWRTHVPMKSSWSPWFSRLLLPWSSSSQQPFRIPRKVSCVQQLSIVPNSLPRDGYIRRRTAQCHFIICVSLDQQTFGHVDNRPNSVLRDWGPGSTAHCSILHHYQTATPWILTQSGFLHTFSMTSRLRILHPCSFRSSHQPL